MHLTVSVISLVDSVVVKSGPVEVMSLSAMVFLLSWSVVKKPSSDTSGFVIVFSDNSVIGPSVWEDS
jgi:hypothetical protein